MKLLCDAEKRRNSAGGVKTVNTNMCRVLLASFIILVPNGIIGFAKSPITAGIIQDQTQARNKGELQLPSTISVIDHEINNGDASYKQRKDELDTFADLQDDPNNASFPASFTICSTVMSSMANGGQFFAILDQEGANYLAAYIDPGSMSSLILRIGLFTMKMKMKIPRVFPEQWISSCIGVNTESGLFQWVVGAQLIENSTLEEEIGAIAPKHPLSLSGNLLLGALSNGPGIWSMTRNQVTLMNVFSYSVSIEDMQKMTTFVEDRCSYQGDYLSWENMRWNLKGHATEETRASEDICRGQSGVQIFSS